MINRNLTSAVEDLESRRQPVDGEPTILNVRFVDIDLRQTFPQVIRYRRPDRENSAILAATVSPKESRGEPAA